MKNKLVILLFSVLVFAVLFSFSVGAEENFSVEAYGFENFQMLFDANRNTYEQSRFDARLILEKRGGIGHLYIEFDMLPEKWTLTDNETGKSIDCGKNRFLHEYIDVTSLLGETSSLTLGFPEGMYITDIYAFSPGELPDWVQKWDTPCDRADLMLISSHSDDEQLFFAGVLPYYAIERKLSVQVVYTVQHFEADGVRNHQRPHEQLDGLWTVGVRNYPVMSYFPDLYSENTNRDAAFTAAEKVFSEHDITYDDFIAYITECIRRFKPLVVVSHDLDGEYGHGTHVFTSSALIEAIGFAADSEKYPESAEKYGIWETEKTYLHLYKENSIVMDWDIPYESMGGKTPFEMTQKGFGCHKSQHYTWFNDWLYGNGSITKASQIKYYSPCEYGLYDTKVGYDTVGGDFMENVIPYSERPEEKEEDPDIEESEKETYILGSQNGISDNKSEKKNGISKWISVIIISCGISFISVILIVLVYKKMNRSKNRRRRR